MSNKSEKEQTEKELLDVIDAHAIIESAEQAEERTRAMDRRIQRYAEEYRKMLSCPSDPEIHRKQQNRG